MILLVVACSRAPAESISGFSGKSALGCRNDGTPLHQCAARLTGLHPLRSSFWVDPRPHTVPVRLLLFTDDSPPARNMTEFERDLDLVLSFLQRMFLAKEHKLGSIYKGCKKDRNADTCAAYK